MMKMQTILIFLSAVMFVSCGEKSLQKYLVEKQDDPGFLKMDVSPSLLQGKESKMSKESEEALKSIKKINVIAYPVKEGNQEDFILEKTEIESILSDNRYQELTRIKNQEWSLNISYTGTDTRIDEVIVYGVDHSRGFAVFRLLGNNLKPEQLSSIIQAVSQGDIDLSGITGLEEIFR